MAVGRRLGHGTIRQQERGADMTEHEFIIWLTRTALAPDWSENGEFYQELILRRLAKVGTVIVRDGSYEIVRRDEHDVRR